jgi:hypothetical protein
MIVQGPVLLGWKRGLRPYIENGAIQWGQGPSMGRLEAWMRARVGVAGRPDWLFVKLHTHGAPERNQEVVLGEAMVSFHEALADRARGEERFHYHYVTAREMYNLARAAEAGWAGTVDGARDFELLGNVGGEQAVRLAS